MTPSAEQIRSAVAEQAGEWFIANQDGILDASERAAFVAWLKASPLHIEEYLGIASIARDLPLAANDPDVSMEALLSEALADDDNVVSLDRSIPARQPPIRRSHFVRGWSFAAAAAIVLLAIGIWWAHDGEFLGLPKTYSTAHGEQSAWQLPDGTRLHLNTDSAVTVRYSDSERLVLLDHGQALFDVAHDAARRFRVSAGQGQIVAVGTQFDVYRQADAVVVTVAEGTVGVFTGEPEATPAAMALPEHSQHVGAGYQVRINAGSGWSQPVPVDTQAALGWLHQEIVFQSRPLGEVADEFNRYNATKIEIDDPTLRALPVSGLFNAYDTDSFGTFLGTLDGVAVQKTPGHIRVFNLATGELPPADR